MSRFYIPKPCHEKWEHMTPREQGRHCAVCSKVVVDFTQKTTAEIQRALTGTQGEVCGQFKIGQLDAQAQRRVFLHPRNLFNRNIRYLALAVLGLFVSSKKAEAQKTKGSVMRGGARPVYTHNNSVTALKLSGTVLTSDQKPAANARIVLSAGGKTIASLQTMANGTFSFTFEAGREPAGNRVSLLVVYGAYQPKYVENVMLAKTGNTVRIVLEQELMLLGQVMLMPDTVNVETADTIAQDTGHHLPAAGTLAIEPACFPADTSLKTAPVQPNQNEENPVQPQIPVQPALRPEDLFMILYPNPASTTATVYCSGKGMYALELFDLKGTCLMSRSFRGTSVDLDISTLPGGTYFVRLTGEDQKVNTLKLVKQ